MSNLLIHLSKDTLPIEMVRKFVNWCVWEQSLPALLIILDQNQLQDVVQIINKATEIDALIDASQHSANIIQNMPKGENPLALSTAEATLFLNNRMATAAQDPDWDPEGVAFFAAQICGWAGFAQSSFTDATQKVVAEELARQEQENYLQKLWETYGKSTPADDSE